ncbi:microphthalmia-associated transcription factor-like [Saccostrea echinata]|uniref:microphthalmia-associated transcription factor-like n=1 Tax=Saccostrea echinata TaxID=191078 RepID=UPI002A83F2ED|nr:microphthalmia-associated transcription factor-like [Saccostrea echinata]
MASMFQPSKALKEIRKQLKQLNQQYREECEIKEMDRISEKNNNSSEQLILSGFPKKQTTEEEKDLGALENRSKLDTLHFQTFLEEACEPPADLSEHVESVITTMIENLENSPQESTSQELHQINTDMEDEEECSIDQVDHLIGDVINSVQTDSSYDEDLHCIEQAVACTISKVNQKCSLGATDKSLLKDNPQTVTFLSKKEEQLRRKERIRKDNHNIIERRRRYKINDRIQELAALLPPTVHPAMKLHKGSILKASVDYIKELKKDTSRLILVESKRKAMDTKYHKMLLKLFNGKNGKWNT